MTSRGYGSAAKWRWRGVHQHVCRRVNIWVSAQGAERGEEYEGAEDAAGDCGAGSAEERPALLRGAAIHAFNHREALPF